MHAHTTKVCVSFCFRLNLFSVLVPNFQLNHVIVQDFSLNLCTLKGVPALTEEELTNLSPTAAAVAKIVKPGMKLMEV